MSSDMLDMLAQHHMAIEAERERRYGSMDATLKAVDMAIEDRSEPYRPTYLGAGWAGEKCQRKIWNNFRWLTPPEELDSASLYRFSDGHYCEDLMAERLRRVDKMKLVTHDAMGKQFFLSAIGGHLVGARDGVIEGLLEDPRPHVWEHKAVNEKEFNRLDGIRYKEGEFSALGLWKENYYWQGQIYMKLSNIDRHYMTVSSPGGRNHLSIRTKLDEDSTEKKLKNLTTVVRSETPPVKITDNPESFECRFCKHLSRCQQKANFPEANCRTCIHSEPTSNGKWWCNEKKSYLSKPQQIQACGNHVYIPELIPAQVLEADETKNIIAYQMPNGYRWTNGTENKRPSHYSSHELQHAPVGLMGDPMIEVLRNEFKGNFAPTDTRQG